MSQSRDCVLSDIFTMSKKINEIDRKFMVNVDFQSVPLDELVNLKEAMRILYLAEENVVIANKLKKDGMI